MTDYTLEEVEARIAAIFATAKAEADDNPDSMRYHQRDQGGSTYADYAALAKARPWMDLRDRLRAKRD